MNVIVYALCVHNGELYAGGEFTAAGGVTAKHIARWNVYIDRHYRHNWIY
jgi:hypothetical protein